MAVFRVERTGDYTVMSNFHLKDKRLSLKAKGLLSQMLSLPDDWDYTLSGLSYINRESKDAIRSAVNETLYEHCAEIEETAKKRMEIIVPQLAKAYGVTEQLKAENQIEWVRQMNACVAQAEEAIKGELIYC